MCCVKRYPVRMSVLKSSILHSQLMLNLRYLHLFQYNMNRTKNIKFKKGKHFLRATKNKPEVYQRMSWCAFRTIAQKESRFYVRFQFVFHSGALNLASNTIYVIEFIYIYIYWSNRNIDNVFCYTAPRRTTKFKFSTRHK